MTFFGFDVSSTPLILGVVTGAAYAVLAVALVLIFRSSGIVNLALGEIGAIGAVFVAVAVAEWGWWYWPAFLCAIAIAGAAGAAVNMTVIRRLRRAPRVLTLVAMLGVGQVLFSLSAGFGSLVEEGTGRVHPPGLPTFEIGAFLVTPSHAAAFVLCPLVIVGVVLFLRLHPLGRAMRASAAAPDLARASGISPGAMSSLSWALAGGLAALVGILLMPGEQSGGQTLGLWLLLRPLAAAAVAGMRNLAGAAVAGFAIGMVEQVTLWNSTDVGTRDVLLFVIVAVAVVVRKTSSDHRSEKGAWLQVSPVVGSERVREVIRNPLVRLTAAVVALGVISALLATTSPTGAMRLYFVFAFATVGLSVAVITGLGGELSLGQFAVAGLGAAASVTVTTSIGNFVLGLAAAAAVAALATIALGSISARSGAQSFAVVTLAFAVAVESWLLARDWIFGDGVFPGQPVVLGLPLDTSRRYAPFAFAVFLVALVMVRNAWQTQIGRCITARRDNEAAARALGIDPWKTRLTGYALGGAVAGLGGAAFVHGLFLVTPGTFTLASNVDPVALTALGGLGTVWGPPLGAFYISGLPELLPSGWGALATTSLGWLLLILLFPGGMAQAGAAVADRIARRRDGRVRETIGEHRIPRLMPSDRSSRDTSTSGPILQLSGLSRSFGDIVALDAVTLSVRPQEHVAVIGANGAGKTTLLDVIGGSVSPDAGRVVFDGIDVTAWAPEERADKGVIRSFEGADLFITMTVLDVVHLGVGRRAPRHPLHLIVRGRGAERASAERARELVRLMGLEPFAHRRIGELSTGMRRLAELALVIACEPRLLLLDEPTSGIAQAEVEVLVDVLKGVARHLDLTMMVVEHDLAVAAALCSRVVVLEGGRLASEHDSGQIRRISGLSRNKDRSERGNI